MSEVELVDSAIDRCVSFFTSENYKRELLDAKKEFFEQAGIVDDEGLQFEHRMAQFLDWYIFSRELTSYNLPPVKLLLEENLLDLSEKELPLYEALAGIRHSVFEFIKVRGNDVYIKDLFERKKIVLKNSSIFVGFNPDELFEARVVPLGKNNIFTKGFCFHPSQARKFILGEIKKIRFLESEQHEALMLRLMKMRYKMDQYKHIKLEFIYTNDPKIKF